MTPSLTILLRKNLMMEKRAWIGSLFEVMLICVCYTIIVLNPAVNPRNHLLELEDAKRTQFYENCTTLYDLSAFLRLKGIQRNRLRYGLIYGPSTPFTKRLMEATSKSLDLRNVFPIQNEQSLINHFNDRKYLAGIYFHNISHVEDAHTVPEKLSVTLSFPSEFRTSKHSDIYNRLWLTRCSGVLNDFDTDRLQHADLYLREGFLQIQHRLFVEWLKMLQSGSLDHAEIDYSLPTISVRSLRHHTDHEPCHTECSSNLIWFLYYFTFFLPFLRVIKKFSRECEANIPAHHWIYGYERGHHWMAHFLISFGHFLILAIIVVALVTIEWTNIEKYHIFRHVNPGILVLFIALYIIMLLIYSMVVSTIFVTSSSCMLFGAAMWLGSYGLFSIILDSTEEFNASVVISMLLFFNNFFPYGMRLMKNVDSELYYRRIWMLIYTEIGNIILLLFLLFVADVVRPGRYMKRWHFNYLFIPSCYRRLRCSEKSQSHKRRTTLGASRPSWYNFECGPVSGQEILYVENLTTYKNRIRNIPQLKNISIHFYKNEISIILGPHGTGKTQLISMLAGWRKPQVGGIYFYEDYDIYENWWHYRSIMDVVMPTNALYDLLSVNETIRYFCEVKEMEKSVNSQETANKSEILKWLNILEPHIMDANVLVQNLSYSQQRLLSLCCSLAFNREIILLDEPTSLMTLAEQIYYWEILRQEKQNRSIILATSSIDEADAIGDRIAIFSEGSLLVWGTPFFLKARFGNGFNLIILKDPDTSTQPIIEVIRQFIPSARPHREIGEQLIYKLSSDKRELFQRILINLEKRANELGISYIQMSGSELSEVYMVLGQNETSNPVSPELFNYAQFFKRNNDATPDATLHQMNAMLYKKMIHQAPNIIPIIMIFAVFLLIVLINEMTKRIHVPSTVNDGIHLGLPQNASSRGLLDQFGNCSFVEIVETLPAQQQTKLNNKPKYFLFKQFECGQKSYQQNILHDPGIYDKLGAVEFMEQGRLAILWINERIFHTAVLSLNLAHNLILRQLYPDKSEVLTTIINKPMIIPLHVKINLIDNQISHLRVPLTMGIIMPITMACFIVSLVEERYSHLLTLQRISGLRNWIYWLVGILWDFGTFFAFSIIYFLVMLASTIEGFGTKAKFLTLLLVNVHGISALCFIYLMSLFMPDSRYGSFLIAIIVQFIVGLCAYVFYWDVADNSRLFYYLLSLSPTFSLLDGISNIYTENKEQEYCRERCRAITGCVLDNMCLLIPNCCADNYFKWSSPGILPSLTFMILSGMLSSTLYFLTDIYRKEKLHSPTRRIKQMRTVSFPCDDNEVVTEKIRIADMDVSSCRKYQILADQMEYLVPEQSNRLNTISFALERHTCLGIYGSHRAGKTHLIQQLIGDRSLRFGELYICGTDCKYNPQRAYQDVGYCPQDRGLCNAFTPRQLLTLLLMIRGIAKPLASANLRDIFRSLNLLHHMNSRICFLPNEIKRRVNIAISLVASHKVLILDEPTRGMSAEDRQLVCNILRESRNWGNSILFSSSDSVECELLADKLIVVDNGELLAIGSPHHLKRKYTKGFYLEVRLQVDGNTTKEIEENQEKDTQNMLTYVRFLHEESILINRYRNTLKYYIPQEDVVNSYLFGSLEKNRRRLSISEYTISQPSLLTALSNILATRLLREPYRKEIKSPKVLDNIKVLSIDPNTEDTRNSSDHFQELSDNIEMEAIGVGEEISFVVQTDDISSITSKSQDEKEPEKRSKEK